MTTLKYNLLIFLLLGLSMTIQAAEPLLKKEFTREVHKSFDVSPGVELGVQNKYGDINITTWDKNRIEIDVLIKVNSSNSEKAEKFLNEIVIDFESSSSKVIAKTLYPDQENSSWWSGWFGNNKNLDYEVHYTIHAPKQMSTSLVNKYGNISQTSIDGNSNIINKYGDIFNEDVSGELTLDLGYGKANIGNAGSSNIDIKYSSLKMVEVGDLHINTKYSDIKIKRCKTMISSSKYDDYTIGQVGNLKNEGKYDEFKIGTIDVIEIETKYTDLDINKLMVKGKFETGYGSVDVKETGSSLEKIYIQSKYTGFSFGSISAFHLDFDGSHTSLHIAQPYEKYNSNKDGSDLQIKAYRGSKEGNTQIRAYMKYGGLHID